MRRSIRFIVLAILVFGCATLASAQMLFQGAAPKRSDPFPSIDLVKDDLVEHVLQEAQRELGRTMDASFKARLKQNLLARSAAELNTILAEGHALTPVLDTLGSQTGDLVYTPLPTPCRFYDTRAGSGYQGNGTGPLAAGTPVTVVAAGQCGSTYPATKAVAVDIVAVSPAGVGNLRTWPWDSTNPPAPNASVINYVAGQNLANGVIIPICNVATATGGMCTQDIFIEPFNHATDVVMDMLGYFAAPVATPVETVQETAAFSAPPQSGAGAVTPACPAGYTLTGGGFTSGPLYGPQGSQAIENGPIFYLGNWVWSCVGYNNQPAGGATWTGTCTAICSRIPGR